MAITIDEEHALGADGPPERVRPVRTFYESTAMNVEDALATPCITDNRPINGDELRPSSSEPQLSVLLIEDDVELCDLMREFFAARGIRIEAIHDGRRGLAQAFAVSYDLILLDVMLPGLDGFEVLRQVRRRSAVPIIMLTARTDKADRIAGLDSGADDYLPKPFDPEELTARIRAVLRRAGGMGPRGCGHHRGERCQALCGHARSLGRRQAD